MTADVAVAAAAIATVSLTVFEQELSGHHSSGEPPPPGDRHGGKRNVDVGLYGHASTHLRAKTGYGRCGRGISVSAKCEILCSTDVDTRTSSSGAKQKRGTSLNLRAV